MAGPKNTIFLCLIEIKNGIFCCQENSLVKNMQKMGKKAKTETYFEANQLFKFSKICLFSIDFVLINVHLNQLGCRKNVFYI